MTTPALPSASVRHVRAAQPSIMRIQYTLLALSLAAAYPLGASAAGPAGVAQFAIGDVSIRKPDGGIDPVTKGKDIESGQSIITGASGRAQLRFSDGGLISLQPNTEFKIANYVDQADPKQDRFLVDLLRGSMRAITGLIGKRNRDNYKVNTATATIGIRGSGFKVGYNPDGSLGITTELDAIEVCNAGGCVGLTAGESVRVVNSTTAPERTNVQATVATPPPDQDPANVGNKTDNDGKASIVTSVSVKQVFTDLAVGIAYNDTATNNVSLETYIPDGSVSVLTSLVTGKLTEFSQIDGSYRIDFKDGSGGFATGGNLGKPTDVDFVGWGSWVSGQKVDGGNASAIDAIHYVLGRPTPAADMPGNNLQGTYQLAGGTAFSNTLGMGELVSGSMVANFGGIGSGVLNLNTTFGGNPYALSANLDINNSRITSSSGSSTNVTGFFTGANAGRAALVYTSPGNGAAGQISGAAALQQTSLVNMGPPL